MSEMFIGDSNQTFCGGAPLLSSISMRNSKNFLSFLMIGNQWVQQENEHFHYTNKHSVPRNVFQFSVVECDELLRSEFFAFTFLSKQLNISKTLFGRGISSHAN